MYLLQCIVITHLYRFGTTVNILYILPITYVVLVYWYTSVCMRRQSGILKTNIIFFCVINYY